MQQKDHQDINARWKDKDKSLQYNFQFLEIAIFIGRGLAASYSSPVLFTVPGDSKVVPVVETWKLCDWQLRPHPRCNRALVLGLSSNPVGRLFQLWEQRQKMLCHQTDIYSRLCVNEYSFPPPGLSCTITEVTLISCDHNHMKSSFIVDSATGQITRSTERISSYGTKQNIY